MKVLSSIEEFLLLTIKLLGDDAYGAAIRQKMLTKTGKHWSVGTIYDSLSRMEEKKYIRVRKIESVPERGGKSKKIYEITREGFEALYGHRKLREDFEMEINTLRWDFTVDDL